MQYTVTIPGWIPNPRRRRETRKLVAAHCQRMGVPVATGRRHVTVAFDVLLDSFMGGSCGLIAGAYMGSLVMDALQWSGMAKGNDNIISTSMSKGATGPSTTIELVDLIGEEVSE